MVVALSTACATSGQQSIGDFLDDAAVTTRVKRKLAVDAGESTLAVEVDTVSGVVHLQGAVRSAQDRRTAEAVVRAVVGVKDVVNRLVVKSP
jgi:hyperosmotically inducible periplasmic protein